MKQEHLTLSVRPILIVLVAIGLSLSMRSEAASLPADARVEPVLGVRSVAQQCQGQPMRVRAEDLFCLREIGELAAHPDDDLVAFVVTRLDKAENEYRRSIWLADLARDAARPFTGSEARDWAPEWSPDGERLAFLSDRSGSPQVWVIPRSGGGPRRVTELEQGVQEFTWSPDGGELAVISDSSPADRTDPRWPDWRDTTSDVQVMTRLRYRAGTEYLGRSYSHLYKVSVAGDSVTRLTSSPHDDTSPVWSPDGRYIAFVSNRSDRPDFNRDSDIWIFDLTRGSPRRLTGSPGTDSQPIWSPDGSRIAFRGNHHPHDYGSQYDVWVASVDDSVPTNVTKQLDRWVAEIAWASPGELVVSYNEEGNVEMARVGAEGGRVRRIFGDRGQVLDFDVGAEGMIAYAWSTPTSPSELYAFRLRDDTASGARTVQRKLTSLNLEWAESRRLVQSDSIWFRGAEDWSVQGWIMRPASYEKGQSYPLILEVHGGPYGMYGNRFHFEFQLLAAQGWGVLFLNPRGSTGYGQDFEHAVTAGDLGGKAYVDLMSGVDEATRRYSWIDENRLGVTGGSYGGFMTNWIVGHTDRFAAAVTQRSLSNWLSYYGTGDIPSWVELEFGSTPWEEPMTLWEESPVAYAGQITTPTMVLHSELDFRVPISQGEELYRALRRRGVPTIFVRFPDEGHGLSRSGQPVHRLERLNWITHWFDRHLE